MLIDKDLGVFNPSIKEDPPPPPAPLLNGPIVFIPPAPQLYTFGHNLYGQLGLGDLDNRYVPTFVMQL